MAWATVFLVYAQLFETDLPASEIFEDIDNASSIDVGPNRIEVRNFFIDILKSNYSQKTPVFVIYNRIIVKDQSDKTFLLQLKYDIARKKNKLYAIADPWEIEDLVKKPNLIAKIFRRIKRETPQRKILLFTWDHGSIFGIFRISKQDPINEKLKKSLTAEIIVETETSIVWAQQNKPVHHYWNSIHSKSEPPFRDILTNSELGLAIKKGFGKVPILTMMNCAMQNVFTQFDVSKSVNTLIAPYGTIREPGYNYTFILNTISSHPSIGAKKLVGVIIESIDKNDRYSQQFLDFMKEWIILGVNLTKYNMIVNYINQSSKALIRELDHDSRKFAKELSDLIQHVPAFDPFDIMVDLKDVMNVLAENHNEELFKPLYDKLVLLSRKHVHETKFIGEHAFPPTYDQPKQPSGVSILLPKEKFSLMDNRNLFPVFIKDTFKLQAPLLAKTYWKDFIFSFWIYS